MIYNIQYVHLAVTKGIIFCHLYICALRYACSASVSSSPTESMGAMSHGFAMWPSHTEGIGIIGTG